jgi:hypothetical protein
MYLKSKDTARETVSEKALEVQSCAEEVRYSSKESSSSSESESDSDVNELSSHIASHRLPVALP